MMVSLKMLGVCRSRSELVKVSLPQHLAHPTEKCGNPAEMSILNGSGQLGK